MSEQGTDERGMGNKHTSERDTYAADARGGRTGALDITVLAVDAATTGFWHPDDPVADPAFVAERHDLFDGSFCWPVMALRRSAVAHNVATMAAFCRRHGLAFAPHGKTSMSPSLFADQLAAGAWGITVATANQLLVAWSWGVPRIILANELVDPPRLAWLARALAAAPGREVLLYVDSLEGVALADEAVHGHGRLRVLVEIGHAGGRTGARDPGTVDAVARAVAAADGLELAGVAAYEGGLREAANVASYLGEVRCTVLRLHDAGLLDSKPVITAGGSAWFDVLADVLADPWQEGLHPMVLLRSGAYVSHDNGVYAVKTPFTRVPQQGSLVAGLEVWAQVTSRPEPDLAIVGMGKREAPYDEGLPVLRAVRRRGSVTTEPMAGLQVAATDDHHSYLPVPAGVRLDVGDLLCFGVSHPCTAFDKWRAMPLLEDDDTVAGVVRTFF